MSSLPMDSKHNLAQFVSAHAQSSIHCACGGMPHQQSQPPAQRALPRAYPLHKGRWLQLSHKIVRGGLPRHCDKIHSICTLRSLDAGAAMGNGILWRIIRYLLQGIQEALSFTTLMV